MGTMYCAVLKSERCMTNLERRHRVWEIHSLVNQTSHMEQVADKGRPACLVRRPTPFSRFSLVAVNRLQIFLVAMKLARLLYFKQQGRAIALMASMGSLHVILASFA